MKKITPTLKKNTLWGVTMVSSIVAATFLGNVWQGQSALVDDLTKGLINSAHADVPVDSGPVKGDCSSDCSGDCGGGCSY